MKGDFTRFTHDLTKHYAKVLKQQGRVDLDADWNEYVEIQEHLEQTTNTDVIGPCGVPRTGGGFMIGAAPGDDLTISPGRIYVDGILCELEAEAEATYLSQPDYPNPPALDSFEGHTHLVYLDVWQRHITAIEDPDIREVALGGPDTTTRVKTVWQVKILSNVGSIACEDQIPEQWPPLPPLLQRGQLSTQTVSPPADEDPCVIAPGGGYRGLENRLYRVEIHKGGNLDAATFKWARDNGSVVFGVEEFVSGDSTKVKVKRLERDQVLALHVGDWVEVLGDETELQGKPGTLARIKHVDEVERVVTLNKPVSDHSDEGHPKVRRWDQRDDAITVTADPIPLEDGIQIRFSGNNFETGDYWVFAARTATGTVEELVEATPHGIEHHYCRLALITWQQGNLVIQKDCRRIFPSLTDITTAGERGIHITEVALQVDKRLLRNGDEVSLAELGQGLRVVCDKHIDQDTINQATCFVTLDLPFLTTIEPNPGLSAALGYYPLTLAAADPDVVDDDNIIWEPKQETYNALKGHLEPLLTALGSEGSILAHLTLKGNFIWGWEGEEQLYLDGEAFGIPNDSGGTDLYLPSGDGRRGGDFEMWFRVVKGQAEIGLPRNQKLIVGMLTGRIGTPGNFNEWVGWKWRDRGTQALANEPLWSVDFATGEIIPGLAAGDPVYNEDFTEVTIPLREGVAWDDGEPFTAADVAFTIETLMAYEGFNAYSFFNENVESVTAVDDHTVSVKLKIPNSRFHTTFLDRWGCTWIMPKHIFEGVEDPVTFEFDPFVGTGPYKLHSYDENGFWTIWEKREDWDKSPTGILHGNPVPQHIVFQAFADEGDKISAQLEHQLDAVDLSVEGLKAALTQSETNRAYQPSFPWGVNNDPCITGLTFNTKKYPYDDPGVRWALLLAIDIVEYMGMAVDGIGTLSPVHVPHLGPYPELYIEPMQEWLMELEIDLGFGEKFKPYDSNVPAQVAEYAKDRGYVFPEGEEYIEKMFGLGWYRYMPKTAEELLKNIGFAKEDDDGWCLPNGEPWKIEILSRSDTSHPEFKNAAAAAEQWKKFGINAVHVPSDDVSSLTGNGEFDVAGNWPAQEPLGIGPDLYRVLDFYNSKYVEKEEGTLTKGHTSRWSSGSMDELLMGLRWNNPLDDIEETVDIGIEGLKLLIEEMPSIPTYGYVGFLTWDEYYWTNWPGSENPYTQPYAHWGPFKYMTPFLQPTGRGS